MEEMQDFVERTSAACYSHPSYYALKPAAADFPLRRQRQEGEIKEETLDNITVYSRSLKAPTLQCTVQHYSVQLIH